MSIEFIHYLKPNQRMIVRRISRSKAIEDKAHAVQAAGGQFKVEELGAGKVRLFCTCRNKEVAYKTVSLVGNIVRNAVDAIIEKSYESLVKNQGGDT